MHTFSDLVQLSTAFNLKALAAAQNNVIDGFENSGATFLVRFLQMIQLQKAIYVVGMFSMFDAMLQEQLQCSDGFKEAARLLDTKDEVVLKENFLNLRLAINVLKHGNGSSYEQLVKKQEPLHFRVKRQDENFFHEGDVDEVSTLIKVDDAFVLHCAKVIHDVSVSIGLKPI